MKLTNTKIAWRNTWRSPLRSGLVIAAFCIGIFGGLMSFAIMKGMGNRLVENTINNSVSHIQIHQDKFTDNNEIKYMLSPADEILKVITDLPEVKAVSKRNKTIAMASTTTKGLGIMVIGIEPEKERLVTEIHKCLDSNSSYFQSPRKNRILVGKKLAEKLKLKVKSKVILTFQDINGDLVGGSFKVEGIYNTNNTTFDENNVFVRAKDLSRLLDISQNSTHEIAIMLKDVKQSSVVQEKLLKAYPNYNIETWFDLDPLLQMTQNMTSYMLFILMIIIMLALGFAIINTMLMAILERTKELGMIMAIGMNRKKVFSMIMKETTILALSGGVVGLAITYLTITWLSIIGINMGVFADGLEAIGYDAIVYPKLEIKDYVTVIIFVLTTGIISSIFPAIRALKMNPVEAIRN